MTLLHLTVPIFKDNLTFLYFFFFFRETPAILLPSIYFILNFWLNYKQILDYYI